MNLIKPNKFLLLVVNPALLLIGLLLYFYYPSQIISIFHVFWILIPCILFLMISGKRNVRLSNVHDHTKRLSWQSWFCSIVVFELLIVGSYLGIASLCGEFLLVQTGPHPDLFKTSLQMITLNTGLYPWSLYAIIAAGVGIVVYHKQSDSYLSELLKPLLKSTTQSALGIMANIGYRRCVLFSCAILLAFTSLLFANFLAPFNIHVAHGYNTHAMIVTLILFSLGFSDRIKNLVLRLFAKKIPMYFSLPLFCLSLGLVCIVLTIITKNFYELPSQAPNTIKAFTWIHGPWEKTWSIFTFLWFLCLTPLVTIFIARISKGYRVRDVIIGVLALPVATVFFSILTKNVHWNMTFSPIVITLISVICLLLFLSLVLSYSQLPNAVFAYLPKNGIYKHRDYHRFISDLLRLTLILLFLFLTLGLNGVTIFLFAVNFLTILSMPLAAISITLP